MGLQSCLRICRGFHPRLFRLSSFRALEKLEVIKRPVERLKDALMSRIAI